MARPKIGFVGIGAMGRRMAPHIADAGFPLHVFDINTAAAAELARTHNGIVAEASGREVAEACDAVIVMLPAGADVHSATFDPGGLAEGFTPGKVLIDMGSSEPWLTEALAAELAGHGVGLFDAPVSGGIKGAEDATLTLMVGGEDAVVAPWIDLLGTMSGHIFRTGKAGSGHAVKALNNLLGGINILAAAEALLIGKRFGVDPAVAVDVINQSTGMSAATQRIFAQQVFNRAFDAGFAFDLRFKDLSTAIDLAHRTGTAAPLSGLCYQLYGAAKGYLGPGQDHTDIVRWAEHMADTELTAGD